VSTDHLSSLEEALSAATIREYGEGGRSRTPADAMLRAGRASRARRRSPKSWPAIAVVSFAFVLAATAAAAIVVFGERGSAPLTGSVPVLRLLHYNVPVTPDLEAGDAGWCSSPSFSIRGIAPLSGAGTCSPAYPPGTPILLAGGEPLSNADNLLESAHAHLTATQLQTNLFWSVVSSKVAAIKLKRGLTVAARSDPRLAPGWKAVVAFEVGQVDPVALDATGHAIRERGALRQLTLSATRKYEGGARAASSPCVIQPPRLSWVTASWEVVATSTPTLGSNVDPNVLFSCARSWYSIRGISTSPSAAVLLDARNPNRTAPAPPGLKATAQPGVFSEDGGGPGTILATRVGRAWLLVQGSSVSTDEALLHALRVEGSAIARASDS